jgi:photosystem II stability/assembly factor-like uncharacterized protein
MNKHKRTYLILAVILLLGTFFTLGFSNITNNGNPDLVFQPSDLGKPGFTNGVGWVVGDSVVGDSGKLYGTILHTTDGGDTWVRQGTPDEIPDADFTSVSTIDACNAWVVGGKSDDFGVILRTEDGGQSWTRQGDTTQIPDVETSAVYAVNKRIAWVVGGDNVILHTKDGGETWKRQDLGTIPTYNLSGVYASDANHVWVVGGLTPPCPDDICGIILHSKDSGKTWKQLTYVPNPKAPGGYLILVHGLNAKTVWVVGNGTVQHTADGGETWQEQVPGVAFFDYNGVFAVNKNTVWVSRDADGIYKYDGTQWHSQTSPKVGFYNLRISALDSQTAWLVGTCRDCNDEQGIIYHTTTGGDIWEAQDPGTDTGLWGVSFIKSGFCNPNR